MRTAGRPVSVLLTFAAALTLIGCTPSAGPLGTPSSPAPTGDASVAPPSGDVAPGASGAPSGAASSAPASPSPSNDATAPSTQPPATPTAAPTATPTPTGTIVVRAYFILGTETTADGLPVGITPVLREVPQTQGVAAAALRALFAGPTGAEGDASPALHTFVPSGTRLLGVSIKGGIATVQVSREFASGTVNATWGAVAQVVYTATQFSTVTAVDFQVEGGVFPVAFGSPPTRKDFEGLGMLAPISIDRPAWGASAGNPAVVTGRANVFEATFRAQIKDASGKVLVDQQVHASCGTGCWGDFSTKLAYAVGKAQWGTLRAYDLSAKDGSVVDVIEYPVWLTPRG